MALEFSRHISENPWIYIFIKILQLGVELFHADRRKDRQRDMTKPIVAFRNFTKAHKKYTFCPQSVFMFFV